MKPATTQQPHVHGAAQLLVVLEGGQLYIELHSPAMNLLGFEHEATTTGQKAVADSARNTLTDAEKLFQFRPGICHMTEQTVNVETALETPDDNGNTQRSDEHGEHAHEAHGHRDIEARYRYRCEEPAELDSMSTRLLAELPGRQALKVQWIAGGRQGAITLHNSRQSIIFR